MKKYLYPDREIYKGVYKDKRGFIYIVPHSEHKYRWLAKIVVKRWNKKNELQATLIKGLDYDE